MVTRTAVPETPSVDTNGPPNITIQNVRQELWSATDSESDTERVWNSHDPASTDMPTTSAQSEEVPDALRPGNTSKTLSYEQDEANPWGDAAKAPTSLPAAPDPKSELESVPSPLRPGPARSETNPFKRKPVQKSQSTQDVAATAQASSQPPVDAFSTLEIRDPEQNTNPWQPALHEKKSSATVPPVLPLSDQESGGNIWGSGGISKKSSPGPALSAPALLSQLPTGDSQPWNDIPAKASLQSLPEKSLEADEFLADQHAWDGLGSDKKKDKQAATPQQSQLQSASVDSWNLIDHEPIPEPVPGTLSKQSTWENFKDADKEELKRKAAQTTTATSAAAAATAAAAAAAATTTTTSTTTTTGDGDGDPPALPPRNGGNASTSQPSGTQSQATSKAETYQIKNINWFDSSAAQNPRKSPILVQNANGPCPLVALVNALTLTTPADQPNSNLVEMLRSREQISINFLLEAVFDELISSRRTKPDVALPDMTELYGFLKGLHTGMNVNPRFIPTPEAVAAYEQTSLGHVHPSERGNLIPGTFETTRDMELYAAFSIPLIHGWLPPKEDAVYESLSRQGSSYDDIQSLLFREEELEDKLSNPDEGLTEQEQLLYQDILLIKSFLYDTATQLTPLGIEIITKAIPPGTVAILFRNDHFSTLYRHPQTHRLFTLVTDAGYLTHDEIVWESLDDVRGEQAEFFSGDFRIVSGVQSQRSDNAPGAWYDEAEPGNNGNEGGWQTAQSRRSRNNRQRNSDPDSSLSPSREQEDRDMALALQLQEEEEERHRAEQAARRRESQLSEQFIEQQGRQGNRSGPRNRGGSVGRGGSSPQLSARSSSVSQPISIPPRTGSQARGGRPVQQVRSLIPPVSTTHRPPTEVDDAPPSYEQASKATPYVPPAGHPSHPESSPRNSAPRRASPRRTSAGPSNPNRARQQASPVAAGNGGGQTNGPKERDCVIM